MVWLTLAFGPVCGVICAQDIEGGTEVRVAAEALRTWVVAQPPDNLDKRFTPGFLKGVPKADLTKSLKSLHSSVGPLLKIRSLRMTAPYQATVEFTTGKKAIVTVNLGVEAKSPHRIETLIFQSVQAESETFDQVLADVRRLPGKTGVRIERLQPRPAVLARHNDRVVMSVASTFKLIVLAAVVDDVEQGKRKWNDVVTTRRDWLSLSSGLIQDWPLGSPVTLHTLTTLMISQSDNSAADHLMATLGRARIETMQRDLGLREPARNEPFLRTGELFRLKLVMSAADAAAYAGMNRREREAFLNEKVATTALASPRVSRLPQRIEDIEWFFTMEDLAKVLTWLHDPRRDPMVRGILGIVRPFHLDETVWPMVWYKGGAEPGVLSYAVLVKHHSGTVYALTMAWNRTDADVDADRWSQVAERLLRTLEGMAAP